MARSRTRKSNAVARAGSDVMQLADVHAAPGHLMRRAQQIAVAIFFEEFKKWGVTPVQFAALVAIRDRPGLDQRTLVNSIAIDRSTVGSVLRVMEDRQLISRITPPDNLRIKRLYIRPAGEKLLDETRDTIQVVQTRILAPLDPKEQAVFLEYLGRVVQINNELSRAPLRSEPESSVASSLAGVSPAGHGTRRNGAIVRTKVV